MTDPYPQPGDPVPGAPPALLGAATPTPAPEPASGSAFRSTRMPLGTRSMIAATIGLITAELIHRLARSGRRPTLTRPGVQS